MDATRRRRLNRANLSTYAGRLLAAAGGARTRPGPDGLIYAVGYRRALPPAPAFTVGDVIVFRSETSLRRPRLLRHESRHAEQYAACGGLTFLPLYAAASLWSWARTGDPASRNVFERRAGLADGGYRERPVRPLRRRRTPVSASAPARFAGPGVRMRPVAREGET